MKAVLGGTERVLKAGKSKAFKFPQHPNIEHDPLPPMPVPSCSIVWSMPIVNTTTSEACAAASAAATPEALVPETSIPCTIVVLPPTFAALVMQYELTKKASLLEYMSA